MTKLLSTSMIASASRCLRTISAFVFISALGLIVIEPFKQSLSNNPNCQTERTPATIVTDVTDKPDAEAKPTANCEFAVLS